LRDGADHGPVYLSTINLDEILYITDRRKGADAAVLALGAIDQLPLSQVEATRPRVLAAARIKAQRSLSYADSFAVSTALEFDCPVVMGDTEFKTVSDLIHIEWLS
jgi:predicted nucleic acid-binding protein